MLTKRSKSMKECYEKILGDLDKMKKAEEEFTDFRNVMLADQTYSEKYKQAKIETAQKTTDQTISVCARDAINAVYKLNELVESAPEPVDVSDSKKQNTLTMLTTLGADLPFEQVAYFVESAKGDFRWLEILGKMLDRYGFKYHADLCEQYREIPTEFKLAELVGKLACVEQRPREVNEYYFGWYVVDFKKWLKNLDCTVADSPDFKEQVARLKQELAMRNAENESLREKDALHIELINHLTDKIGE